MNHVTRFFRDLCFCITIILLAAESPGQLNAAPAPADSALLVQYRTDTYRQWADAKDQKNKRLAVKPKPNKVAWMIRLVAPGPGNSNGLQLKFTMSTTLCVDTFCFNGPVKNTGGFVGTFDSGAVVIAQGVGTKGKQM